MAKCKLVVITYGQGMVEAGGEILQVTAIGLCGGDGGSAGEVEGASVVDLHDKAFRGEAVRVGQGAGGDVGEGDGYTLCKGMGDIVSSGSKVVF